MSRLNLEDLYYIEDRPTWDGPDMCSAAVEPTPELLDYAIDWMTHYERDYSEGRTFTEDDFRFAVYLDRNAYSMIELRWDVKGIDDPYGFKVNLNDQETEDLLWSFLMFYL